MGKPACPVRSGPSWRVRGPMSGSPAGRHVIRRNRDCCRASQRPICAGTWPGLIAIRHARLGQYARFGVQRKVFELIHSDVERGLPVDRRAVPDRHVQRVEVRSSSDLSSIRPSCADRGRADQLVRHRERRSLERCPARTYRRDCARYQHGLPVTKCGVMLDVRSRGPIGRRG